VRAAIHEQYGAPSRVVEIREIEKPEPGPDEVLVRVRAASVNIADWYGVAGRPWVGRLSTGVRRPKGTRRGVDYAGVVESVGSDVTVSAR
jgi:NADPH:quinone reductase-like Zn-dependent oxidoreductase